MSIKELSKKIHQINVKNGFYEDKKNIGEMLALIHSEVSEALEADRKGFYCQYVRISVPIEESLGGDGQSSINSAEYCLELKDDDVFKHHFKSKVKDNFEDELADIMIRVMDLAEFKGIDIESHINAKLRYNSLREYKHGKKY
jgi:NTP pyrophosphatase (non-canonical NTP hydrolase)